jgi:hypothetical protein
VNPVRSARAMLDVGGVDSVWASDRASTPLSEEVGSRKARERDKVRDGLGDDDAQRGAEQQAGSECRQFSNVCP